VLGCGQVEEERVGVVPAVATVMDVVLVDGGGVGDCGGCVQAAHHTQLKWPGKASSRIIQHSNIGGKIISF